MQEHQWALARCTSECTCSGLSHIVKTCEKEDGAAAALPHALELLELGRDRLHCEVVRHCLLAVARALEYHRLRKCVVERYPATLDLLVHIAIAAERATVRKGAVRCIALLAKSPVPTSAHDGAVISLLYHQMEDETGDMRVECWWGLGVFCAASEQRMTCLADLATRHRLRQLAGELNVPFITKLLFS